MLRASRKLVIPNGKETLGMVLSSIPIHSVRPIWDALKETRKKRGFYFFFLSFAVAEKNDLDLFLVASHLSGTPAMQLCNLIARQER